MDIFHRSIEWYPISKGVSVRYTDNPPQTIIAGSGYIFVTDISDLGKHRCSFVEVSEGVIVNKKLALDEQGCLCSEAYMLTDDDARAFFSKK